VLHPSNPKATVCYERADEARQKANAASNETERTDYLAAEARWIRLAQSYEFSDRINTFLSETRLVHSRQFCTYCQADLRFQSAVVIQFSGGLENRTYECVRCGKTYKFTMAESEPR
jgi:hypothetical protein